MGQVCTAGSRLFVHADIYDEFLKKAVARAKRRTVGNPFDSSIESGPQVLLVLIILVLHYVFVKLNFISSLSCFDDIHKSAILLNKYQYLRNVIKE